MLEMLRDDEHFPFPAILMSVHFEAKTNLYFGLCVYKMVTIFVGGWETVFRLTSFCTHFSKVSLQLIHKLIIAKTFKNIKDYVKMQNTIWHLNYQQDFR